MKKRKNNSPQFIIIDALVISVSLISAFIIRSRFSFFLFSDLQLTLTLPYVILLRILTNIFFEHYSKSSMNYHVSDIISLYFHHAIPSIVFLFIRFASPLLMFKMPISMIFAEYFFTVTWMVLTRLFYQSHYKKKYQSNSRRQYQSFLLLNEITEKMNNNIDNIINRYNLEIIGILAPSHLLWNTDFRGIRIMGGYDLLKDVVKCYSGNIYVIIDDRIPFHKRYKLYSDCYEIGLSILYYREHDILFPTDSLLTNKNHNIVDLLSQEIISEFADTSFFIRGDRTALGDIFIKRSIKENILKPENILKEKQDNKTNSVILDLRFNDKSYTNELYEDDLFYLINKMIPDRDTEIPLLILFPVAFILKKGIHLDIFEYIASSNISILFIETIHGVWKNEDINGPFIDYPEIIISTIYKLFHILKTKKNGIYYFRSTEAINIEELYKIHKTFVFGKSIDENYKSEEKNKIDLILRLLPTVYNGLYSCDKI